MNRVDDYLHHLTNAANGVSDALIGLEHATKQAQPDEINSHCARLGGLLVDLQAKVEQRETLLADSVFGKRPASIQAALNGINHPLARELTERCKWVGDELQFIQQRAVGLFIGQFHLSNTTEEFLRLLSGVSAQSCTYDQETEEVGGSFLDKAA